MLRPRHLLLTLAGATLVAAMGCGRWMEYAPLRVHVRTTNPNAVYKRLVHRSQTLGYRIEAHNPYRRQFAVRAFLDQRRIRNSRASFFHVTVHPSGVVDVAATGFHVRRAGVIHRKLCHELTAFMDAMARVAQGNVALVSVQ